MLVHVVGPVAHRALQTLVPDTTHLHWNLLHRNVVFILFPLDFYIITLLITPENIKDTRKFFTR